MLLLLGLCACGDGSRQGVTGDCGEDWRPRFQTDSVVYPFAPHCFEHVLGTVHYLDEGPRDSPRTAVLFHGNTSWSILWRDVIPALVDRGYRVVAPDLLGFGLSDQPSFEAFSYRPSAQSEVMEDLVVALDLHEAVFFVQDWGGPIGLGVAGRLPARTAGLVITNTLAFPPSREPQIFYRLLELSALAHTLEEPFASGCIAIRSNAVQMALAFDSTRGEFFERIRAQMLAPFVDPETDTPRRARGCLATAIMAQSIIDEADFLQEVEDGLRDLDRVPVSLVFSAGDPILGEQHCEITPTEQLCPTGLQCVCDPSLLVETETCPGTARSSGAAAWVCRTQGGESVFPAVEKLRRIVGETRLVGRRSVGGRVRHFTPAYAEARGPLLAALRDLETRAE